MPRRTPSSARGRRRRPLEASQAVRYAATSKRSKTLKADVKAGGQDRADVAVMLQGYRVLKDLVELERKIKEQDGLAVRIEDLEAVLEHRNGGGIGYG